MLEWAVFNYKTQGLLGVLRWERFGKKSKTDANNKMSEIWDVHIGLQDLEGREKSGRALRWGPQRGGRQQVGLLAGTGPVKVPCDGEVSRITGWEVISYPELLLSSIICDIILKSL